MHGRGPHAAKRVKNVDAYPKFKKVAVIIADMEGSMEDFSMLTSQGVMKVVKESVTIMIVSMRDRSIYFLCNMLEVCQG